MRSISFNSQVRRWLALFAAGCGVLLLAEISNAQPRFQAPITASYGATSYGIAYGDFNGDGKLDVVVGAFGPSFSAVSLLLNDGNGGFLPATSVATGTNPQTIAVGDFNHDGKLDMVTANYSGNNVSFLKGNGDGTFAAPVNFAVGNSPQHIVAGDFNGDGNLDFATANYTGNTVTVWLGNGSGGFGTRKDYAVGVNPRYIAVGDLNNDGASDLVIANNGSSANSISVLVNKNDGTGFFLNAVPFPTGAITRTVALGDLDGDGNLDAVVTTGTNTVGVLRGNGSGGFSAATNYATASNPADAAVADFDGDGKKDVLVIGSTGGAASLLRGNGNGTLQPKVDYATGSGPVSLLVADFNGDGKPDFATANQGANSITLYLNNGNGTFPVAPLTNGLTSKPAAIATGDFNGDGRLDIVTADSASNNLRVGLGNGDGTFTVLAPIPADIAPAGVVTADFNKDGKLDIAVINQFGGTAGIYFGKGDGTFTAMGTYDTGPTDSDFTSPQAIAVGDFNGDGFPDLAIANNNTFYVTLLLNTGAGTFTTSFTDDTINPLPGYGTAITTGDMDGDGKTDLIVATQSSDTVTVLRGNGDGTFKAPQSISVGTDPFGVAVADLNGDGKLDVVVAGYTDGVISVLPGKGDGTLLTKTDYVAGNTPYAVLVGDFDGDGKLDIASVNAGSSSVTILRGTGSGAFQYAANYAVGASPRSFAPGDFDGDGKPDIVVANYDSSALTTLLNGMPRPSVSGVLTFSGLAPTAAPQIVTFAFRPTGGSGFTRRMAVSANGVFTLTNIPAGVYNLWIKGDKYLAQVVPGVDTTGGNVTGITSLQIPGDATNDNTVNIGDFGLLVNAYSDLYDVNDPNADPGDIAADFNGDGIINIGDFGLLVNSFGSDGEP